MKIKRDAFLYLEPSVGKAKDFAQCESCALYVGKTRRCLIHGPTLSISPEASCGFYIYGDLIGGVTPKALVSPTESGLVRRQVRCENCAFYRDYKCMLFAWLDRNKPEWFDLGTRVDPKACCNANTAKGTSAAIGESVRRAYDAIQAR